MMIRIKDPDKAERLRRARDDKSPTETVNALIDESATATDLAHTSRKAVEDAIVSIRGGNNVSALLILERMLDGLGGEK